MLCDLLPQSLDTEFSLLYHKGSMKIMYEAVYFQNYSGSISSIGKILFQVIL